MPGAESNVATPSVSGAVPYKPLRAAIDAVINRATPVYNKVTPYVTPVYNKVTPYVPASVLTAAINVTNVATTKVLSYGPVANTALDAVDKKVVLVIDYIHTKEIPSIPSVSVAIPVQWVSAVNTAIKPILSHQLVTDIQGKITHFYTVASTTLLELKEKNNTAVKREEFIKELKSKLAHQWDERLQKPAEELYEKSKTIVLSQVDAVSKNDYVIALRTSLGEKWELAVQEVYHKRLETTLKQIYSIAAAYYLTLYQKGGEQAASLANYLNGLKHHLEITYPQYTGKIEPLLKQAYDSIKNLVSKIPSLTKSIPSAEQSAAAAAAVNNVAAN